MTLGGHLRKKRLDLGLRQKKVAERLGVDKDSVYNWETNRYSPSLRVVPRIIQFLGYLPYEIAELSPGPFPSCYGEDIQPLGERSNN